MPRRTLIAGGWVITCDQALGDIPNGDILIDAGKIINTLAGRNQIQGAVVMGIGMALLERTEYDPQNGAPINSSLADYIVAVNADAPAVEVHFLDYPDKEINQVGARGIGEIGLAGIAASGL